jgi:paraquat-inducible protein A
MDLIACPACSMLHHKEELPAGAAAYCRRCATSLYRIRAFALDRPLALALAGLIVFAVANLYPFLTLQMEGRAQETLLASGARALFRQGHWALAAIVLSTGIVLPFLQLAGVLYILLPLRLGVTPPGLAAACRWVRRIRPWVMVEIFLLGTLVSVVKLSHMARIVPGAALFAFMALMFIVPAVMTGLPWESIWERVRRTGQPPFTARTALVSCPTCHLVSAGAGRRGPERSRCPRCGGSTHRRKPASLMRTWALVLTAMILYIPANVLPVTLTTSLGQTKADTILSGVIYFMSTGSWPIALVIFTASIVVPLAKLAVLVFLLISVRFKSAWRPVDRTRLYRLTEAVGRWSMLDVFVLTMLVALVRMGNLASIEAGPGGIYFAAVVITTMLAADAFDPRLIWDALEERR